MSRLDEIEKEIELLNAEKEKILQAEKENELAQNWKDLQNPPSKVSRLLLFQKNQETQGILQFCPFLYAKI